MSKWDSERFSFVMDPFSNTHTHDESFYLFCCWFRRVSCSNSNKIDIPANRQSNHDNSSDIFVVGPRRRGYQSSNSLGSLTGSCRSKWWSLRISDTAMGLCDSRRFVSASTTTSSLLSPIQLHPSRKKRSMHVKLVAPLLTLKPLGPFMMEETRSCGDFSTFRWTMTDSQTTRASFGSCIRTVTICTGVFGQQSTMQMRLHLKALPDEGPNFMVELWSLDLTQCR